MNDKTNPVNAQLTNGLNLQNRGKNVVFPANILEQARKGGKDGLLQAALEQVARGEAAPVIHSDTFGYINTDSENAEQPQMPLLAGVTVGETAAELQPQTSGKNIEAAVVLSSHDAIEALRDVVSHYVSWRDALTILRDSARAAMNSADESYYQHELNVLERVHNALHNVPLPAWKPNA